ncbi:MAG: hypothetical protein IMW98_08525 [Firmicutes bacterium]|nr:hypothetical protein [Bacillota bacterium]MBE3590850.1 hypothetical protein [Bacillota bacterium]
MPDYLADWWTCPKCGATWRRTHTVGDWLCPRRCEGALPRLATVAEVARELERRAETFFMAMEGAERDG